MFFAKKRRSSQRVYSSKKRRSTRASKIISWLKRVLIIVFVLTCFIVVVLKSDLLKISKVECQFQNEEVCRLIEEDLLKKSYFKIDGDEIKKNVKINFPQIREINFNKKFPQIIRVEILERQPVAVIIKQKIEQTAGQEMITKSYFLIDSEGMLFRQTQSPPENLSLLEMNDGLMSNDNFQLGMIIPQGQSVTQLLNFLQNNPKINPQKISISQEEISLSLEDKLEVVIPLGEEILGAVKKLEMILAHYQEQEINLKRVDLRFDKPVVVY